MAGPVPLAKLGSEKKKNYTDKWNLVVFSSLWEGVVLYTHTKKKKLPHSTELQCLCNTNQTLITCSKVKTFIAAGGIVVGQSQACMKCFVTNYKVNSLDFVPYCSFLNAVHSVTSDIN